MTKFLDPNDPEVAAIIQEKAGRLKIGLEIDPIIDEIIRDGIHIMKSSLNETIDKEFNKYHKQQKPTTMGKKKLKLISGSKERAEEVEEVLKSWGAEYCYIRGSREDVFYYVDGNTEKTIGKDSDILQYIDYEVIELPEKSKRWRDNDSADFSGYWINSYSSIKYFSRLTNIDQNYNVFATKKQAKSALAMAQISQIMANDERFGGVVTDEEWNNDEHKYEIIRRKDGIDQYSVTTSYYNFLAFHTQEQRDLFFAENEDLVKDYFML